MTEIQILAGSSDKPSISSEGFSHSIFTAPVGSHLQKCVPKPLKDTSLWPWVGEWGPLHREDLTVQALFCFGGAHTTHAQPFRASPSVPCWMDFGTRRVWHGVFWNPACPPSYRTSIPAPEHWPSVPPLRPDLSVWAAQARKSDTHSAFCSHFLSVVLLHFLQLNTASWLSLNLHH